MIRIFVLTLLSISGFACSKLENMYMIPGNGEVNYQITLDATWSATTHPENFPTNPHFSGVIGASHNVNFEQWREGEYSSPAIEVMAESGSKSVLESEIRKQQQAGNVDKLISIGGISTSPGKLLIMIPMNSSHPYISLTTMLAPSPDWFIGVNAVNLIDNGLWVNSKSIDLYAFDAGTDDGADYTAENIDADPKQVISRIEVSPFAANQQLRKVATLTFKKI